MIDSCSPRKLDPGFAQTYSIPRDLITSTMKSDPVRSVVRISTAGKELSSASGEMGMAAGVIGSGAGSFAGVTAAVAIIAAPVVELFRKSRRLTNFFLQGRMGD